MSDKKTLFDVINASIERSLIPILKDVEAKSYAAGWKAAMETISATAATASGSVSAITASLSTAQYTGEAHIVPLNIGGETVSAFARETAGNYVLQFIREEPGCTGARIIEALANRGNPLNDNTVRTALHRFKATRTIINENGRWFFSPDFPDKMQMALAVERLEKVDGEVSSD